MMARATLIRLALLSTALAPWPAAAPSVRSAIRSADFSPIPIRTPPSLNAGVVPRQIAGKLPRNAKEKPIVLPVASQDINCPEVDIADGGASLRVGGPENASVRYQFNIGDTARQCDPAGPGQAALKVGVAGEVVIGPAGAAGTFSAPVKITVTEQGDNSTVFSQTYRAEATTDGVRAGSFRMVTDPISLPMPTLQLADIYTITVGFEGGTAVRTGHTTRKKRRTAG